MALSIVIAGGGTGGHVTPALAIGEEIARRDRGDRVLFVGSDRGLEARLVPEAGFELLALPSRQVMGRGIVGRALGALSILGASLRAWSALRRVRAELVISVGGYAAMPAVVAAALRRTPLVLLEPNAVPGRVNRLAARLSRRVFVGFEAAGRRLDPRWDPSHKSGAVRCVGIPLRRALRCAFGASGTPSRRRPEPPFRLLVFGGSQGARQINDAMIAALPRLAALSIEVVHQTGEADRERVAAAYADSGVAGEAVAFEHDMPARYRWADMALCRAGALTVAELALAGLPSLLVPYPYAADDHQKANAEELEAAGAALCLDGHALDGDGLAQAIESLTSDPARLDAMAEAATRRARPDAAAALVDESIALVEGAR